MLWVGLNVHVISKALDISRFIICTIDGTLPWGARIMLSPISRLLHEHGSFLLKHNRNRYPIVEANTQIKKWRMFRMSSSSLILNYFLLHSSSLKYILHMGYLNSHFPQTMWVYSNLIHSYTSSFWQTIPTWSINWSLALSTNSRWVTLANCIYSSKFISRGIGGLAT